MTSLLFTCVPGPQDDLFDAALRRRRNPADVFRRQRAEAAHLAHHRSALHLVRPDHRALDGRRRRLQPRQADADEHDGQQTDAGVDRLLDPFLLRIGRASNIHGCFVCLDGKFWENDRAFAGANVAPVAGARLSHYIAASYVDAKGVADGAKVSGCGTSSSRESAESSAGRGPRGRRRRSVGIELRRDCSAGARRPRPTSRGGSGRRDPGSSRRRRRRRR